MNFTFARFPGVASAERAVGKLLDRSIDPRQIRVLAASDGAVQRVPLKRQHSTQAMIIAGATLGTLGGLFAGAMGAAELGQLGSVASGAIGGGGLGALIGALASLGHWRLVPRLPEDTRAEHGIVVGAVTLPQRSETAREALAAADAERLHQTSAEVGRAAATELLAGTARAA
jgi:hypothetical protein